MNNLCLKVRTFKPNKIIVTNIYYIISGKQYIVSGTCTWLMGTVHCCQWRALKID